ncbi:MAG: ABC transporter ATP-binding protein [Anaerolineae bacterium]|nr:ABC transporter ATP-binding protein [Anaerolineae bacterium]
MHVVRTESLSKVYGDSNQPVHALRDVHLTVEKGELLAVMGPSGSGKSTLLYMLGALERPTSGKVWLHDKDLSTLNDDTLSQIRRTALGFVFQFFNLIPVLTARENVAIPLILDGVPRADALKHADEALAKVGLTDRSTHRPAELSGGQQQRVTLARALVGNPALILADEPTGNLDSRSSEEVIALLRRATDEWDQTVVLVTHDPRIAAYADRIIFLKDGQIVDENRLKGQGSADQIREQLGRVAVKEG